MNKQNLTDQEKRELYNKGQYLFSVPPVCHASWNSEDWIKYIDNGGGKWITDIAKNIIDGNPYNIPMRECDFYKWLLDGNYQGHKIHDLRGYLDSKGFEKGRDILTNEVINCLRYQQEYYFYWEIKPGLES